VTTLLAVDGNSLVHRAWHGGTDEPTPGWVTARVIGLLSLAWAHAPIDAVLIGFDGPGNRRKGWDPAYKAHRSEKDDGLVDAMADVPTDLADCGFAVECPHDGEADDVLVAAAKATRERGWDCLVMTSDRDLLPVIADGALILRPGSGAMDLLDSNRVVAEFGVTPSQYQDLAVLRGDPSDGLPGVPGIGEKTARRLLRDYDNLDGIYAALPWLPPKFEAAMRAGRERVAHNRRMMGALDDVTADVDQAAALGVDPARVDALLVPRGHGFAAGRFRRAVARGPLPPTAPLPDGPMDEFAMDAPHRIRIDLHDGEQASLF